MCKIGTPSDIINVMQHAYAAPVFRRTSPDSPESLVNLPSLLTTIDISPIYASCLDPAVGKGLEEIRSKRMIVAAGVDPSLSMGRIVVHESWRLAALIYLFLALCGADPKDARVTEVHAKFMKLYTGVEARRIPDSFLVLPMSIVSQGL
ncbi:unnamed protein product [Rhizoctonia solani]|nr:unnamed protein product [Rhizoctonia solani]